MAYLHRGPAFGPDRTPENEPDTGIVGAQDAAQDAAQDNDDENTGEEQLANNNSWWSSDTVMADATDAVADTGSSLLDSSLTYHELPQLTESPAPENLPRGRSIASSPLSELGTEWDSDIGNGQSQVEERATTPQSEGGIITLDNYAFNFNCDAYNHRVPRHFTTGITLNVERLHPHRITLAQHCQKLDKTGERIVCPPLIPVQNEISPQYESSVKCIWVGMLPSQTSSQDSDATAVRIAVDSDCLETDTLDGTWKKSTGKKAAFRGSILNLTEDNMRAVPFDSDALRVVAKKSTTATEYWYLYAVIKPSPLTNLCQGYKVSMGDVYFFKEFRDDQATSFMHRKYATKERIRARKFSPLPLSVFAGPAGLPDSTSTINTTPRSSRKNDEVNDDLETVHQARSSSLSPRDTDTDKSVPTSSVTLLSPQSLAKTTPRLTTISKADNNTRHCITSATRQYIDQGTGPSDAEFEDHMECCQDEDHEGMDLDLESSSDLESMITEQGGHDEQRCPSPIFAVKDAARNKYRNKTIKKFQDNQDQVSKLQKKNKSVAFQDTKVQYLDKPGARIKPGNTDSAVVHDGDGHRRSPKGENSPNEAAKLSKQITKAVSRLAAEQDIARLDHALTIVKSLEQARRPCRASVLGLYLNVPAEGDVNSRIDIAELWVSSDLIDLSLLWGLSISCR